VKVAGLVLAGGRSSRFGSDKALAMLGGRPLIAWSLEALRSCGRILGVNGPEALAAHVGLPSVPDEARLPAGPYAGVIAGLAWARRHGCTHLLIAPCDTPFLPADFGPRLASAIGDRRVVAVRAERAHPLCSLWSLEASAALHDMAREGKRPSMQAFVASIGGFVDFEDEKAFANINTAEELAEAELFQASRTGGSSAR
jgi:molybdopterin-guanine dinucleotide biosynthesis protein A